jgi:putative endonuclease
LSFGPSFRWGKRQLESSQKYKAMKQYAFWFYIMTNVSNRVLYAGVTNNILRRVQEHRTSKGSDFTSKYKVNKLVYVDKFQYIDQAIQKETQVKTWQRAWKVDMIEKLNPEWQDLTSTLLTEAQ